MIVYKMSSIHRLSQDARKFAAIACGFFVTSVAQGATLSYLPEQPVAGTPIALRIDDVMPNSGFEVQPHTAEVGVGRIIVRGCVGGGGFSVPRAYSVTVPVPPLAAGLYAVEYQRSVCGLSPPFSRIAGSWTLLVEEEGIAEPPRALGTVFEYYHRQFRHYFMTTLDSEKLAIELGSFVGWERVGPHPWSPPSAGFAFLNGPGNDGRVPLCRFFSAAFQGKSSHFYTATSTECDAVKTNPNWTFEGIAGYVWPASSNGTCDAGIPLYRVYNNGQRGAPNHRYTTDHNTRLSMIVEGWTPEGAGPGVVACVPPRAS